MDRAPPWIVFRKKLVRLLKDALRLARKEAIDPDARVSRRARLDQRLAALIDAVDTARASRFHPREDGRLGEEGWLVVARNLLPTKRAENSI